MIHHSPPPVRTIRETVVEVEAAEDTRLQRIIQCQEHDFRVEYTKLLAERDHLVEELGIQERVMGAEILNLREQLAIFVETVQETKAAMAT